MTAATILTNMLPENVVSMRATQIQQAIDNAAVFITTYDISDERKNLAQALYAGHLLSQSGVLQPVVSKSFDGGSISYLNYNITLEGSSTWLQEFQKLVPSFYSPGVVL